MNDLSFKNRKIFFILLYPIVLFVLIYFVFRPLISNIRFSTEKIQENKIDQELENARLGKLPEMENDWKKVEAGEELFNVMLEPSSEIEFIENIESIAAETGCSIALNIGEQSDPKEIKKIRKANQKKGAESQGILDEISAEFFFPVQINLKGDYKSLINFIRMLESSQIYVNIISIQIGKEAVEEKALAPENDKKKSEEAELKKRKEILNTTIGGIVYIRNKNE